MHLPHLLEHLPHLQQLAQAPTLTPEELQLLESSLQRALENMATYRLVSATPLQLQEYFYLLDAYARDMSWQHMGARQRLAQDALRLCQALCHLPVS
ncbi:hypothetical protein [Hymenobacter pini]|uniref:hypothetical protein n=1 Tax=Hymenobacter pini TaxID=2880879 RepID=UPI001CF11200|nr:hypothetical protein [Hymenobacter pini]MCA8830497.1 hypothetical protein [Hymenobacter pini]